jgi:hypothetical protein
MEVAMIRLVVHVIGTDVATNQERNLAKIEIDRFDPMLIDLQIEAALQHAKATIGGVDLEALRVWRPEVSVAVSSDDDEVVRPSFHLTAERLEQLGRAGASLDFDPYV